MIFRRMRVLDAGANLVVGPTPIQPCVPKIDGIGEYLAQP